MYEFNLLYHVGVVAKRMPAGDGGGVKIINKPSSFKHGLDQ